MVPMSPLRRLGLRQGESAEESYFTSASCRRGAAPPDEHFVFLKRFQGRLGHGRDGDDVPERVKDLDGIFPPRRLAPDGDR